MANWGQVVNNLVCNAVTCNPTTVFTKEWLDNNPPFQVIPDGIVSGATFDGTNYTNPVVVKPIVYKEVRKWEFATFATTAVGGSGAFGTIIKACRDSVDNATIGAYELFKSQSTLTYNEASALLTLLVAKSIVTPQQKTDILAAWPIVNS